MWYGHELLTRHLEAWSQARAEAWAFPKRRWGATWFGDDGETLRRECWGVEGEPGDVFLRWRRGWRLLAFRRRLESGGGNRHGIAQRESKN
jgi:hypothetical protein